VESQPIFSEYSLDRNHDFNDLNTFALEMMNENDFLSSSSPPSQIFITENPSSPVDMNEEDFQNLHFLPSLTQTSSDFIQNDQNENQIVQTTTSRRMEKRPRNRRKRETGGELECPYDNCDKVI